MFSPLYNLILHLYGHRYTSNLQTNAKYSRVTKYIQLRHTTIRAMLPGCIITQVKKHLSDKSAFNFHTFIFLVFLKVFIFGIMRIGHS